MKNSRVFFILTIIGIIATIILISLSAYHYNKAYEISGMSYEQFLDNKDKMEEATETGNILKYSSIVVGTISSAVLIIGIIFKVKEKGEKNDKV